MAKIIRCLFLVFAAFNVHAQDSVWTLQRSIQYAVSHNIDISQQALNTRLAALQLQQSRLSQLPGISASGNYGLNYGRSIDPTTNQFINSSYSFAGLSGNADVLLFGWFQKRNTIQQNSLTAQAAQADMSQLADDVSLNVATGFLRALLAKEQIAVAKNQLDLSIQQQAQTRAFVDAGNKPDLDMEQMNAQVAGDSAGYIGALADYQAAILDLKALLNLDMQTPFEAVMPGLDQITYESVIALNAEQIYEQAKAHFGTIKSNELKVRAAEKGLKAARGMLYPQFSLGAQLGTNYASSYKEVNSYKITGVTPSGNFVQIDGTNYDVFQPVVDYTQSTIPFFKQFDNNFRQSFALSVSIPLLNGWSTRTAIKQAQIDVESKKLNKYQSEIKLQQDVYKAYNDATSSVQKYYAAKRAAEASEKAYNYAQKRYELGLVNSVELLTTQNTAFKAETDATSAKYDMIFKLKVIDYYLGKELKL